LINHDTEAVNRLCFDRALSLGLNATDAMVACKAIEGCFQPSIRAALQFEKLYQWYITDSDDHTSPPKEYLGSLTELVEFGLPEAYILSVIICHDVIYEYFGHGDNKHGKFWFEKRAVGQSLNVLQTEVADNYFEVKVYFDLLELLKAKSSTFAMPAPSAIKSVIQRFGGDSDDAWTTAFNDNPELVVHAFHELDVQHLLSLDETNDAVLQHWQSAAVLLNPNQYALAEKIEKSKTTEEKWFWHLIGLTHNIDITKDDLYAINADTGEDYDDYGPMAVAGFEGIVLPEISTEARNELEHFVG
jgi:hypothetical protein